VLKAGRPNVEIAIVIAIVIAEHTNAKRPGGRSGPLS
jgi:hypothetical protein